MSRSIRIFAQKNGYGLSRDAAILGRLLEGWRHRVEQCDQVLWVPNAGTPPVDIHIYMETPCALSMPWAAQNWLVVNPEWFLDDKWSWTVSVMDRFIFKEPRAAEEFQAKHPESVGKTFVIPWTSAPPGATPSTSTKETKENRFLYVIGGSVNKAAAAESIVAAWLPGWPPLEIWCSPEIADRLRPLVPSAVATAATVTFQTEHKPDAEKEERQRTSAYHIVASAAEGFGYTMSEAAAFGVPVLWNPLPVYSWLWAPALGDIGCVASLSDVAAIRAAVQQLLALSAVEKRALRERLADRRAWALRGFRAGFQALLTRREAKEATHTLPPPSFRQKAGEEPPMVGIVTVTRNRGAWWPNAVENIQRQRWPVSRIVWIVVDDSDPDQRLTADVAFVRSKAPALRIEYIVADRAAGATLGAKRNAGVAAAIAAGASVVAMMDDDDHYPETSVPERVRWLLRGGHRSGENDVVGSAVLPMYDITRYISAINVPPLTLSPLERVSEASLAFRVSPARFPVFGEVDVAEGGGLRMSDGSPLCYKEISPSGVIVSFIHTSNSSSRRTPAEQEPNGCHYGFSDAYFKYIHTVGGSV